ncbi:hypothetical protein F4779DRAFT_169523 [Xylariaceae sp. FL0662B]|nr:hypothetical protein F4779DRAFT_169523 [Xylariaceae sp. FL0662B]
MSTTPSDQITDLDRLSEQGWEFVEADNYYTTNFTPDRPPHLNDRNFSSVQNNGPVTQPRGLVDASVGFDIEHMYFDTEGNYTPSSDSVNTESTLKSGDPFVNRPLIRPRTYLDFCLNRNYDGAAQPLTEQAIAAFNHSNNTQRFDGSVSDWLPGLGLGLGIRCPADVAADLSSNKLMPPGPRSHTTKTSDSSWSKLSPALSYYDRDHIAEQIQDVGGQFDITANPNTVLARNIRDEDMYET